MADVLVEQVPVKRRPELRPLVGLDLLDLERQSGQHIVQELDRRPLVRPRVDLQNPQPGAVIDRGVLAVALLAAGVCGDRFDELDVDLHLVAGALLLVALPALLVALVALRGQ